MQGRGGWLGVKPEGSIAEGRARAARAGGCGVNTQKRTRGGRPHQPEMARTLPLRCFPAGLKAVAVLACPPPRPALPGRPRAAEPTASPWRETRPAQRKPGSRAQGSRATQAFYRGGFLRRLRGGACLQPHTAARRLPAAQSAGLLQARCLPWDLAALARSPQEISSARTFCVARPSCHAVCLLLPLSYPNKQPRQFLAAERRPRRPVPIAALLLTGMAAKIPAVLPEPNPLVLSAFVGRGQGAKAQF